MNGVEAYEAASYPTPSPPVPTTPGILQEDAYEWARRNLVARAMALEPIGDIADVSLSGTSGSETITWETSTDWDNAVSEAGVVHETFYGDASQIQLGYPTTDEIGGSGQLEAFWPANDASGDLTNESQDTTGRDLSVSGATHANRTGPFGLSYIDFDGSDDYAENSGGLTGSGSLTLMAWVLYDDLGGGGNPGIHHIASTSFSNKNVGGWVDASDGSVWGRIQHSNGRLDFNDGLSNTTSSGTWFWHAIVVNSGTDARLFTDGTKYDSGSIGTVDTWDSIRIGRQGTDWWDGPHAMWRIYDYALTDSEVISLYDDVQAGSLETATKTVTTPGKPDLTSMSYSLNGQSMDVDVIGSPGEAGEETVTQTLDGSTSFTLTWSNSHTDFRLNIKPSTNDITTTPTFSAASLTT